MLKNALFEALVEEIEIQADDALVPHFRIPTSEWIKGWPSKTQPLINHLLTIRFAYRHIRWTLAGGAGVTLVIGGLAGLYPANRASRLAPTEALATP